MGTKIPISMQPNIATVNSLLKNSFICFRLTIKQISLLTWRLNYYIFFRSETVETI